MKSFFLLCVVFSFQQMKAQELFVYTEPASNMATKTIGARLTNNFIKRKSSSNYSYQLQPEIMWGISKRIMIHAEGLFSNNEMKFKNDGAALYVKYRFYSVDEVHSHFRMAAFARTAFNNKQIYQPAIDLNEYNSGYEAGLVVTKLINKLALSATGSFLHATDNARGNKFQDENRNAMSYSLSAGKLMLPKTYTDYKQTNLNAMIEILGQTNLNSSKTFLDLAPAIQFVFLSKMRLDIGYRFAIVNDLVRNSTSSFLVRFEYNFFNAYK